MSNKTRDKIDRYEGDDEEYVNRGAMDESDLPEGGPVGLCEAFSGDDGPTMDDFMGDLTAVFDRYREYGYTAVLFATNYDPLNGVESHCWMTTDKTPYSQTVGMVEMLARVVNNMFDE